MCKTVKNVMQYKSFSTCNLKKWHNSPRIIEGKKIKKKKKKKRKAVIVYSNHSGV